ncbi:hypothetical protein CH330_08105 [candidate division WOR-3 bacterium JGI_Cruoil_03_51_56]|uniref:DUF86 domain-containing protein n=1 Tax=candidate division WOR-3 bacterium JGI_Cruoil_03_51_56 TaxID=1973747 RepID=A0A235BSU3_UNCW3|nr:MAG: hypothetical protein CH330_08105 [candidate division WOR-3 bacterium JGI_Cruoil_03_51_56]
MQPEERDLALLWDMLEAARDVARFMDGVRFAEFESDKKLRLAVERQMLVIGEAARHVSDGLKAQHPEMPWTAMIGQRNVLAHEYDEILIGRIWTAATQRIPELIRLLEPLVPADEP